MEINNGVPCLHVSNTPYSDMTLSLYFHREGLFLRPETGCWIRTGNPDEPEFQQFIDDVVDGVNERNNAFIQNANRV